MTQDRREEIMMEKAFKALQSIESKEDESFIVLKEKVAEIVRKGLKTAFIWRHLRIDYRVRDEFGVFNCHFHVSNPYTGKRGKIYTKDFIGKTGTIKYAQIASAIKHT